MGEVLLIFIIFIVGAQNQLKLVLCCFFRNLSWISKLISSLWISYLITCYCWVFICSFTRFGSVLKWEKHFSKVKISEQLICCSQSFFHSSKLHCVGTCVQKSQYNSLWICLKSLINVWLTNWFPVIVSNSSQLLNIVSLFMPPHAKLSIPLSNWQTYTYMLYYAMLRACDVSPHLYTHTLVVQ